MAALESTDGTPTNRHDPVEITREQRRVNGASPDVTMEVLAS
jgi:hypothetical protein